MESITIYTHVVNLEALVMKLHKSKSTHGITENTEPKQSNQIQKIPIKLLIFLMDTLLLMTTQMQMKTGKQQMQIKKCTRSL